MKKKNLLVSAIAMLVVSALGLTAATYAWFTASREPALSAIEMEVTTSQALQVSDKGASSTWGGTPALGATDTDWVDTLSLARMQTVAAGANWYAPTKLADSTPGKAAGGVLGAYTAPALSGVGTKTVNNIEFAKSTTVSTGVASAFVNSPSYIRFTIYFRAESPQVVCLDLDKSVFTAEVSGSSVALKSAMRVGFFVHTAADAGVAAPIMVAPNGAVYSAAGQGNTPTNYTTIDATGTHVPVAFNSTGWVSADGGVAGDLLTYTDGTGAAHDLVYLFDLAASTTNSNTNIIGATIYLWLEGFDDNCINTFLGADVTSTLSFYGITKA